jgi:hypothetical protein
MIRFTLRDPHTWLFSLERWCNRSEVDGWLTLADPQPLPLLLETYIPHLDSESFMVRALIRERVGHFGLGELDQEFSQSFDDNLHHLAAFVG